MISYHHFAITYSLCLQSEQVKKVICVMMSIASNAKKPNESYLKLTEACQTNARSINSTGMIGNTSTRGSKGAYASGNFASKKAIIEYLLNSIKTHCPLLHPFFVTFVCQV